MIYLYLFGTCFHFIYVFMIIGNYLKSRNISPEISNLLERVLDYYAKYQNNKAKHDCAVLFSEVEFILYLTGTVMRFLLTNQESHNLL